MDEAIGELSVYDNHPADYGTEMYERSKDVGLLENTRQQIAEIEEAQSAIEEGDYGYCHNCGQSIPESRLIALPRTLFCIQCKRQQEDMDEDNRPVEEDNVFFAGEDAWGAELGRNILPNGEFNP
jgi:RNA polymerase-binding transcription factor DksA